MKLGRDVSRHNELDNWRNTHRYESVMATIWLFLTISETDPGLWDRLLNNPVGTWHTGSERVIPGKSLIRRRRSLRVAIALPHSSHAAVIAEALPLACGGTGSVAVMARSVENQCPLRSLRRFSISGTAAMPIPRNSWCAGCSSIWRGFDKYIGSSSHRSTSSGNISGPACYSAPSSNRRYGKLRTISTVRTLTVVTRLTRSTM